MTIEEELDVEMKRHAVELARIVGRSLSAIVTPTTVRGSTKRISGTFIVAKPRTLAGRKRHGSGILWTPDEVLVVYAWMLMGWKKSLLPDILGRRPGSISRKVSNMRAAESAAGIRVGGAKGLPNTGEYDDEVAKLFKSDPKAFKARARIALATYGVTGTIV